ncbi:response regulator transcription factor [Paenibacillus sp. SYP-B4298]|uniref:response regulator transcription factor n=1 Tax=Paenibacillus sp. SYP-B4298 TaxID=2996034 RepID=UPI0022DE264C|nr:response regulator transcription factor [Paenibacillus sp. SYP-B4298]
MHTIMLVEDDPKLAALLLSYLERYGYRVRAADDFGAILRQFEEIQPDMVLLDINLPRFDGYYWCRQIRTLSTCPILFISARAGEMDQVMALENGGDDYITKPFHYEVVMAKIRSLLRRAYGEYAARPQERICELEGLLLYPERLELELDGSRAALTKKEADIIELLMMHAPRYASRDEILEKLWDDQSYVDENTLNVNIARVRRKLLELGIHDGVETLRGTGYRLVPSWRELER